MKPIFQALAKYNRTVNDELIGILAKLPKVKLMMETKAFYHTIFETLTHILTSDRAWLSRFEKAFPACACFKNNEVTGLDEAAIRRKISEDYAALFDVRRKADDLLERFVNEIGESEYTVSFKYRNYKGEENERILWQTLSQMFNHQTHHRGSISTMLDMMGIENDYSTLLTRI